jgi:hypothetical protein
MFIFAGGLYLVAVCVACALPKDKANARHESEDDYELLDNSEELSSSETSESYGSVS